MNERIERRGFLGFGLLAGLAGLAGCGRKAPRENELGPRFTYDVSAYLKTDPALLLYNETAAIPTGFKEPKRLCLDAAGALWVGGDRAIRRFSAEGEPRAEFAVPDLPQAMAFDPAGQLLVAFKDHHAIFAPDGRPLATGESLGPQAHLTGIAHLAGSIYLADSAAREIVRCDASGKPVSRFGKAKQADGTPGFVVPSPYFTLVAGADGLLWVNNPGRHRVEAYTPEGQFELSWGDTGMAVEGFCGCCNPVYFARLPDGRFVTSEKGLNRIKLYDARGGFLGVVAGPEHLVKDLELAKRACTNCQIGFGFDVACDGRDRVYALDPATRAVRVFEPKSA